jgi:hypothetical protein
MNIEQYKEDMARLISEAPSGKEIDSACNQIKWLLLKKNISYGNSFQSPISIFSKSSKEDQILVRIDDKINRIKSGSEYIGDDTLIDLIGYLILLLVLREQNKQ